MTTTINAFVLLVSAGYLIRFALAACNFHSKEVTTYPTGTSRDAYESTCMNFEDMRNDCSAFSRTYYYKFSFTATPSQIDSFCDYIAEIMILEIEHTQLEYMKPSCLNKFTNLKRILLSHNKIRKIENELFSKKKYLETLDLSSNSIEYIEAGSFAEDKKLKYLYLNDNNITHLITSVFNDLNDLEVLYIDRNHITEINMMTFSPLYRLKTLDLSYNQIESIEEDVFVNNDNLEELRLSNNNIKNFTEPLLSKLHSLRRLDLSNNPAIQFDVNMRKCMLLEELKLSNLAITDGESRFSTNTKLKTLNISHNSITTMDQTSFADTTHIESLDLSFNHISKFEIIPTTKSSIKNISLRNNDLREVPARTFSNCTFLKHLDLAYNSIVSIEKNALEHVSILKSFRLEGNQLKNIPSTLFKDTKLLEYLDLSDNQIEVLFGGTFDSCQNLLALNLSYNHLQNLNEFHLHPLKNLQKLYLQFNELHNIKGVKYLRKLTEISLANNPWKCKDLFDVITTLDNSEHDVNVHSDLDTPDMYHVHHISCEFEDTEHVNASEASTSEDSSIRISHYTTSAYEESSDDNASQMFHDARPDFRKMYFDNYYNTQRPLTMKSYDKHIFYLILALGIITIFILCIHLYLKTRKKEVHKQPEPDQHQLLEIKM